MVCMGLDLNSLEGDVFFQELVTLAALSRESLHYKKSCQTYVIDLYYYMMLFISHLQNLLSCGSEAYCSLTSIVSIQAI